MLHSVPDKPWRQFASGAPGSALVTVLLAVVVVSALYFGREVLVPIALAILLSFVLAPLVRLLQACYVPRVLAVMFCGSCRVRRHLRFRRSDDFASQSTRQ